MQRREFLAGVVGSALGLGLFGARAQGSIPTIGVMSSSDAASGQRHLGGFWKGLAAHGFKEGENVRAEYRWADGHYDRLPVLAEELISIPVQALVCLENTATAIAAKKATSSIPVVFAIGTDP